MRPRLLKLVFVIVLCTFCGFQLYVSTGIVGVTRKARPTAFFQGCICHGDTVSPGVSVWISGPDSLPAGVEALYKVSVLKSANIASGFNVASYRGGLGVSDSSGTHLARPDDSDSLELTHTIPKFANGNDTISWSFYYRAPLLVGFLDTLYSCGNGVDTSQDPSGDYWNFSPNFRVKVTNPTAVSDEPMLARSFRLLQNYPNPFNPSTVIRYELASNADVVLEVFDISGRRVAELVNGSQAVGLHEAMFKEESGNLASAVYFYRLRIIGLNNSNNRTAFSETRKMVLLR